MSDAVKITSVEQVIESVLFTGIEREQFIFRGQVNSWAIEPSLFREFPFSEGNLLEISLMIRMIFSKEIRPLASYSPIEFLSLLQHYGRPTRLLDWTSDVLIALFFACHDETGEYSNTDGVIFSLAKCPYSRLNTNDKQCGIFKKPIDNNSFPLFQTLLNFDKIYIFEPLLKNPRMRAQDGLFVYFPMRHPQNNNEYFSFQDDYYVLKDIAEKEGEKENEPFLTRQTINHNYKDDILKELKEKYGLSKETLFPNCNMGEGLENRLNIIFDEEIIKVRDHIERINSGAIDPVHISKIQSSGIDIDKIRLESNADE